MNDKWLFQMISHIHYDLNDHEDFVILFIFKFITRYIDIHLHAFDSLCEWNPNQLFLFQRGSELIYWILGLQGEVHLGMQATFKNAKDIFTWN